MSSMPKSRSRKSQDSSNSPTKEQVQRGDEFKFSGAQHIGGSPLTGTRAGRTKTEGMKNAGRSGKSFPAKNDPNAVRKLRSVDRFEQDAGMNSSSEPLSAKQRVVREKIRRNKGK